LTITPEFLAFVPRFQAWVASKSLIQRAWVYGSRLRGTQSPDSDLDLALEVLARIDEDPFTVWCSESDDWRAELRSLSPYQIQLEWYGGKETEHASRFISCCSMLVFDRGV
jgi:hypothetical protein